MPLAKLRKQDVSPALVVVPVEDNVPINRPDDTEIDSIVEDRDLIMPSASE